MREMAKKKKKKKRIRRRKRRKHIIYTENLGYLYWVIQVESG
jgi:hypothetical protein